MIRVSFLVGMVARLLGSMKNTSFERVAKASTWNISQIEQFLKTAILPARISCITTEGYPYVMSLWFLYDAQCLYCSVQKKTLISKWLQKNPLCGFEIAGDNAPYKGVRGRGEVLITGAVNNPVLPLLVDKYLGSRNSPLAFSLLSREKTELTLIIKPSWMTSWDYSKRMVKSS